MACNELIGVVNSCGTTGVAETTGVADDDRV